MQKSGTIHNVRNCFGCGVCATICPRNIIEIESNPNGFYEPHIRNTAECVNCGLCCDVCSFLSKDLAIKNRPIKSWAAWSNNDDTRASCSSGGIGFEIGRQLIEKGYKAVGCRYNTEKQRAEHYVATTAEEFLETRGSKYIQSYTVDAFKQLRKKGEKYLVSGTPCQIDSIRRLIRKYQCEDNFILMDFFCHGVPSINVWKAYIRMLEPRIGKITHACWRSKVENGWHDSWIMKIDGEKTMSPTNMHESISKKKTFFQSRMSKGDVFYKLFLGGIALGPQCEKDCKYKYDSSSADIRIGDFWGNTYKENEKGVSAVVAFSEKGVKLIEALENITLVEHPFETASEGQMKKNASHKEVQPVIMALLRKGFSLQSTSVRFLLFIQKVISKLKRL